MSTPDLYLVFSNPRPGREADAVAWYDDVHLPELLELDEVTSAQRFELASEAGDHRFLAVYECATSGTETTTDALDAAGMVRVVYRPATGRRTS